ncbi:LysR family transcriptional regulator [Clostridiaceae bacterium HFYG-1003]|nr:LysR family transcriptional regulator [Clostridiaceae bacterium HFYG-1003]
MNLDSIQTFLLLAQTQSFTRTAEQLFCTQAAVSMRIQRLEEYFECALFTRNKKRAELTKEGQLLLPYAQQIQNSFANARTHLLQSKLMEESHFAITSSSTPGTYILPSLLLKFQQKYPFITIVNNVQYTKNVIDQVLDGTYPMGFISKPEFEAPPELVCESILEDPLLIVVPPDHRFTHRPSINLNELAEETFLISNPHTSLIPYLEQAGKFRFDSKRLFSVGSIEAIKQSLYNRMGISILSESAVRQELDLGLLCRVNLTQSIPLCRNIYYIHRRDRRLTLASDLFLKFIRESLTENSATAFPDPK